jgi:hypothetical protein
MIAVIPYELDFDVDHGSDYANIYADVSILGAYFFDDKEQAREFMPELREWHPGVKWKSAEVKQPAVEKAERDKYQMRMEGDWS